MGIVRAEQVQATRDLLMTAAEHLIAEHGVAAVSARQISDAAGQGNTAAVGYHFGTKTDLVRAILRKHTEDIERIRAQMADEAAQGGADGVRDWVSCLVRPTTGHLAELGAPTWFARFGAQVLTDPQLRPVLMEEAAGTPAITRILRGVNRCLAGLPARVRAERDDMAFALMVHVIAEHERALATRAGHAGQRGADPRISWDHAATGLIDALTGLYQAPVTPGSQPHPAAEPSTATSRGK